MTAQEQQEIENAWVRESEDRLSAYHAGEMGTVSMDEAMKRINALCIDNPAKEPVVMA
jgi:hypothetical protein